MTFKTELNDQPACSSQKQNSSPASEDKTQREENDLSANDLIETKSDADFMKKIEERAKTDTSAMELLITRANHNGRFDMHNAKDEEGRNHAAEEAVLKLVANLDKTAVPAEAMQLT